MLSTNRIAELWSFFGLRAALHYAGEVTGHISSGIMKFDWPRVTLLSGGDLPYGQESFGGEHYTRIKKMT